MGQGGAERQMSYLAVLLKNAGFDIRLIRFYDGDSAYESFLLENNVVIETLISGKKRINRILHIYKIIKNWQPHATIVYKDGTAIAACLAKLFINFRLIVSERNTTQNLTIYERLKFLSYRLATYIVPNSISQACFIKTHYKNLIKKVKVITNYLPIELFRISEIDRPIRVITTARIAPQKNVLNYLRAIKILKDEGIKAQFVWYGKPESEEFFSSVMKLHKDLLLEDYIKFFSEGSKKISKEYEQSTHFCLPSSYEGFPNVLCEAMACGLTCTASNVCDNLEILSDKRFVFNPNHPKEIAEALKFSMGLNLEEREKIAVRNRKRIEEICSPQKFLNSYLELIEK